MDLDCLQLAFKTQLGESDFDIDVNLPKRGITAIFGRSGAGKTTLINVISGLITPDEGHISLADSILFSKQKGQKANINLAIEKRNIGYVFQEARLFPHYSVKGNLLYGVKHYDDTHFSQVIDLLALQPLLTRYPNDLSGGEKQRVAIGRALLCKPKILLMDEPLASLDMPRKREVMPFLEKLSRQIEIPIIYVSHSLNEILRLANHLVVIDEGQVAAAGRLEEVWQSDIMRPWQSFSEQSSLFESELVSHHPNYALSEINLAPGTTLWVQSIDANVGDLLRLQIRANDVSIATKKPLNTSIRNILPAKIAGIHTNSSGKDKQSVSIQLNLGAKHYLNATITHWALDELQLVIGQSVYAQIKGVSVAQKDMAVL